METLTRPGCLIMAAGNAARFRSNKLAAEFDGKALIRRAMEAIPESCFTRIVVVTQYPQIAELAEEFGFVAIRNPHPDYGISYTIRLGTQVLADCDGILYMVSDQPLLDKSSVRRVVEAWQAHPTCIVGAAHNAKRGNPNLFPREFFPELLALTEDHGGNTVIRAHPERFLPVEISPEQLTDVDTPQALQALREQSKRSAE